MVAEHHLGVLGQHLQLGRKLAHERRRARLGQRVEHLVELAVVEVDHVLVGQRRVGIRVEHLGDELVHATALAFPARHLFVRGGVGATLRTRQVHSMARSDRRILARSLGPVLPLRLHHRRRRPGVLAAVECPLRLARLRGLRLRHHVAAQLHGRLDDTARHALLPASCTRSLRFRRCRLVDLRLLVRPRLLLHVDHVALEGEDRGACGQLLVVRVVLQRRALGVELLEA
jgi:hypothetical protein